MIVVVLSSAIDLSRARGSFARTDGFCVDALDFEYAELGRRMVARLVRMRPTPLVRGNVAVWAAGVGYAVARLIFDFDRSDSGGRAPTAIAAGFQIGKGTPSAKATQIEKLLDLRVFEPGL